MLRIIALLGSLFLASAANADYPLKGTYKPPILSYKPNGGWLERGFITVEFKLTNDSDEVAELTEARWAARPEYERVTRGTTTFAPALRIEPHSSVTTTLTMKPIDDVVERDRAEARVYFIGRLTPPGGQPYRAGMQFHFWAQKQSSTAVLASSAYSTRFDFLKIGESVTFHYFDTLCPGAKVVDFHLNDRGERIGVRVDNCFDLVGKINNLDDGDNPIHDGSPTPWLYTAPYRTTGCEVNGMFCIGDELVILNFTWEPMEWLDTYQFLGVQPPYGGFYDFLLRTPTGRLERYLHDNGTTPLPTHAVVGKRQGCLSTTTDSSICVGDKLSTTLVCKGKDSSRTWHFDAKAETVNDGVAPNGFGATFTVSYTCPNDAKKTCYNAAEPNGKLIVAWKDCEK